MSGADGGRRNRAFRIAYDGRRYHGFQRQPSVETVEGAILDAFAALGVDALDTQTGSYAAAGRTDAGASALAQTIAVSCPDWLTPSALNAELPEDVRAWASVDVAGGFHPRYDAIEREYTYELYATGLDVDRAVAVCDRLEGEHDFRNIAAASEQTRRSVTSIELRPAGDFVTLTVRAPAFLRQQVRRMVSLVADIGRGDRAMGFVNRVLGGDDLPGHEAIPPSPAEPLVLTAVLYPDIEFAVDGRAGRRATELFARRSVDARGAGRALAHIGDGIE